MVFPVKASAARTGKGCDSATPTVPLLLETIRPATVESDLWLQRIAAETAALPKTTAAAAAAATTTTTTTSMVNSALIL